jgi:hypothetical protein
MNCCDEFEGDFERVRSQDSIGLFGRVKPTVNHIDLAPLNVPLARVLYNLSIPCHFPFDSNLAEHRLDDPQESSSVWSGRLNWQPHGDGTAH